MSSQSKINRVKKDDGNRKNSDIMSEGINGRGIMAALQERPLRLSQRTRECWSSEGLNSLTTVAGTHEHAQTTNCLSSNSSCKILGTQLISARRRPTGLPSWLADQPVTMSRRSGADDWDSKSLLLILPLIRWRGRHRAANPKSFKKLLGRLLARRERHFVGRCGTWSCGRRLGSDGFNG